MKLSRGCLLISSQEVGAELQRTISEILAKQNIELFSRKIAESIDDIKDIQPIIIFFFKGSGNAEEMFSYLKSISTVDPLCPIIALDPMPSYDSTIGALRNGAADYFSTPIENIVEFESAVNRQLYHAKLFSETEYYREELEHSLAVLQEDQQAGHHVQQKVLPPDSQQLNDYQFNYSLKPSLYLSGDYVDYFRISESLTMFYLADISGHGASSAFVTVLLKNMSNRLLRNYMRGSSFDILSPTDVLSRINKELLETGLGKHLTIFVGLLDRIENTLQYGVGGHFPMPILYQKGEAQYLPGGGMPAGLFEEAEFSGRIVELEEDFQLSIFSDGILEIMQAKSLAEKESMLLQACSTRYDCVSDLLVSLGVDDALEAPDDIALLSVSRAV